MYRRYKQLIAVNLTHIGYAHEDISNRSQLTKLYAQTLFKAQHIYMVYILQLNYSWSKTAQLSYVSVSIR